MITQGISRQEIQKLPYVTAIPQDGRIVPIQTFYDVSTNDWFFYVPHGQAELIRLLDGETISGSYLGHAKADPKRDIEFPLGSLVIQHLSYSGTLAALGKLENDIHRSAAVMEKYHVLWGQRNQGHQSAALLIESELEYLTFLLRSLYDLLQGVIRDLCQRFVRLDDRSAKAMNKLSSSFADIVIQNDEIREPDDLVSRYRMPEALANWYYAEAPFFRELRQLRNGIAHHGQRPPSIFETEWGFAISPSDPPWNMFDEWPVELQWNGRLGSLRAIFAGFIAHSLQAMTRFASTISTLLELPPALGDDLHLFVRSPFGHQLVRLSAMRKQPWEGRDELE
jgi:hypothetical protein